MFNIIVVIVYLLNAFLNFNKNKTKYKDGLMNILFSIIIISLLLGIIAKNPLPLSKTLFLFIPFLGYIIIFDAFKYIELNEQKIKLFLTITFILLIYMMLSAFNFKYGLFWIDTPMLGSEVYFGVNRVGTMLGSYAISGEYALLVFLIFLPFFFSKYTFEKLDIKNRTINILLFSVLVILIFTQMRSNIILIILSWVVYFIILLIKPIDILNKKRNYGIYLFAFIFIIMFSYYFLDLSFLLLRFESLDFEKMDLLNLLSGDDMNRGAVFSVMIPRILNENWLLGYGWGNPETNQISWFGDLYSYNFSDPHSLYLSVLQIFGIFGSIALFMLILITLIRLIKVYKKTKENYSFYPLLSISFISVIVIFLIDEYKTSFLSCNNFIMIFFIWMGLSNALYYNSKSIIEK